MFKIKKEWMYIIWVWAKLITTCSSICGLAWEVWSRNGIIVRVVTYSLKINILVNVQNVPGLTSGKISCYESGIYSKRLQVDDTMTRIKLTLQLVTSHKTVDLIGHYTCTVTED